MKLPSLEAIAEKWTLAHTIALTAWVIALVLGIVLLARHTKDPYPATDLRKVYAGENATFTYPANWTINTCGNGAFIVLPGSIKTDWKGQQAYALSMHGTSAFVCMKNRPERFDLYPEVYVASDKPCGPAGSTKGELMDNGLYLQFQESDDEIVAAHIKQNSCFAPANTYVLSFVFDDPQATFNDPEARARVKKIDFLKSRQYQDIRALAESIKY